MNSPADKNTYDVIIRIGDKVISKTTGDNLKDLQIFLSGRCELEKSGVEGKIIERSTGKVVYSCRKQSAGSD